MLIPINVDVPLERVPWTNWAIIALNLFCFVILAASDEPPSGLILWRHDFHLIQLVGCMYGHAGILHLLGNMIFLFCFGNAVNAKLGHLLYALAYHALGVLAALAWLVTSSGPGCLGASGAIMGVVGMFIVFFPLNDVKIFQFWGFFAFGTFDISAYWVIGAYFAFDLLGLATGDGDGVAYISHVTGAIAGAGLALGLIKLGMVQPGEFERNLLQVMRGEESQSDAKKKLAVIPAPVLPIHRQTSNAYAAPASSPRPQSTQFAARAPVPPVRPGEASFTPTETPDPYDIR
jgi:membrane associated rhomboid family serine protease